MKKKHYLLIVILILLPGVLSAEELILEDFQNQQVKALPTGWKAKSFFGLWYRELKDKDPYRISEDLNNRYLKAESNGDAITIFKLVDYDLKRYNHISWRWKVDRLPKNGAENKKSHGDSAAGFYVAFGIFKTIKYVWSSTLPVGSTTVSPYHSGTKIFVIRSGDTETGKWFTEKRNVAMDYKRAFQKETIDEKPKAVVILTDSDDTDSSAIASYDDIVVSTK
jgi:hypothetical protein